jgi:hypothetical protein
MAGKHIHDIKKLKHKTVTAKDIEKDIKWIYKELGITKMPKIYIADSYKAQKENVQKYNKTGTLASRYNETIRNKGLTRDISEEAIEELRKRYGSTSENVALDRVTEVLTKNTPDFHTDQYFGIGFEMFYSLDLKLNKKIFDFYAKGIFNIEYYEGECFICTNPVAIRFDKKDRLHGGEKAAIEFADGHSYFLVRDVFFEASMWKKIQSRKMPIAEILSLPNVEQRSVAIEFMGPESLLEQADAVKVHGTTARGNTLYDVKLKMGDSNSWNDGGNYTYKLLQYACPSTDRKYASFVPENLTDADEAMAWKFNLTKEEYLTKLKVEQ